MYICIMNSLHKLIKPFVKPRIISETGTRCFHRGFAPVMKQIAKRQRRAGEPAPVHRNNFLEWNYDAEIYSFTKRLGENFDEPLLRQALTDRSYILELEQEQRNVGIENPETKMYDNADMAEQGERLLDDFVVLYLRTVLPRFPEEGIMSIHKYLMSEDILSHISFHIGANDLILCQEFPLEKATLARGFKALCQALQQSSGLDRATIFARDFVLTQIAEMNINELWPIEDPVSALKRICQNEKCTEPEPRLIGQAGVNTILALYRVGLFVDKQLIGYGAGESIDIAHEMAATDVLRRLFHTSEDKLMIPFDLVLDPRTKQVPNVSIDDWSEENVKKRQKPIAQIET